MDYPGRSTKRQISPALLSLQLNMLMLCVLPGVLLSIATFLFCPVKQFKSEDLPTLLRPLKVGDDYKVDESELVRYGYL